MVLLAIQKSLCRSVRGYHLLYRRPLSSWIWDGFVQNDFC
jgi:hypothetical protein